MYFIRCSSKVTHLWCVCVCVVPLCERLSRPVRAKETSFPCNHYNFFNCANSRIVHGSYIYGSGGDLRESVYTAPGSQTAHRLHVCLAPDSHLIRHSSQFVDGQKCQSHVTHVFACSTLCVCVNWHPRQSLHYNLDKVCPTGNSVIQSMLCTC